MKKVLNLLSVLTISITAMSPVINVRSYWKSEKTTTQSENNKTISEEIYNNQATPEQDPPELNISIEQGKMKKYFTNLINEFIPFLQSNGIIRIINSTTVRNNFLNGQFENNHFINPNPNYSYFIMLININGRQMKLVFKSNNFYLQGFIGQNVTTNQYNYYHFSDAEIRNVTVPGIIVSQVNDLRFGSSYQGTNNLNADETMPVHWNGIFAAFNSLVNYIDNPTIVNPNTINTLKRSLVLVVLATSESLRFRRVRNEISCSSINNNTQTWGYYFNNFLRNWDRWTESASQLLSESGTLIGFSQLNIMYQRFLALYQVFLQVVEEILEIEEV